MGAGNRLLPRRFDDDVLARDIDAVVSWVRPRVRRGQFGDREAVVLARKGWRGLRPLSVLSLTDRVAYRALVSLMAESLPEQFRSRGSNDDFRRAPLDVDGAQYVLQADIASFFQYVDHETLGEELLAQTGEEPAVDALLGLLAHLGGAGAGGHHRHQRDGQGGDETWSPKSDTVCAPSTGVTPTSGAAGAAGSCRFRWFSHAFCPTRWGRSAGTSG